MRYWDAVYAFLAAMAVAGLLTPLAGRLARRVGAMSSPSERGLARQPTPLLGGLAILAGFVVAGAIWLPDTITLPHVAHGTPGSAGEVRTWWLIVGGAVIAAVGTLDDIYDLKPVVKLTGQVAAAVIAVYAGAVINDLTIPFVGALQFKEGGDVLTVIWLVALMNIVNFSDGVDGLAAGVCMIDGVAFAVIAFSIEGGTSGAAVLAAMTAGASLGFLFHNFYPAKIFMGDAGSNLLGYLLGTAAVVGSIKTTATVALAVPLLILAVPFLDTSFVVAKRLKYGRKPWSADDYHFHHRMAKIGFSQRKTVAYLYAWTLMLAGVAIALRFVPYSQHYNTVVRIPHHVRHHHHFRLIKWVVTQHHYVLGWSIVMGAILIGAFVASIYLVYVLEILKFRGLRSIQIRRVTPEATEADIDEHVARDVGTGEFEVVRKSS
jgi:UDP-GlcNAc:undecaprenyl-phosphate GlcNAc-1-phosphate transferase